MLPEPAAHPDRHELDRLIVRAQAGEPAAQTALVRRYTPRISAFVRPIVRQSSAVDDIVQLVFIKVLRRLGVLREAAAFESWLFALARNTAVDFVRRRNCRPVMVADEVALATIPCSDSSSREAEILDALEIALRLLRPRDRSLVQMIVRGHSYRDVAVREGLTIGAVKLRLNRVRPILRESVGAAIGLRPVRRLRLVPARRQRPVAPGSQHLSRGQPAALVAAAA